MSTPDPAAVTAFRAALLAVQNRLSEAPAVAPVRRLFRGKRETGRCIVLRPGPSRRQPGMSLSMQEWESVLYVECYASGSEVDAQIDALLLQVSERLEQDSTLGGLVDCMSIEGVDEEYDEQGDRPAGVGILQVLIQQSVLWQGLLLLPTGVVPEPEPDPEP